MLKFYAEKNGIIFSTCYQVTEVIFGTVANIIAGSRFQRLYTKETVEYAVPTSIDDCPLISTYHFTRTLFISCEHGLLGTTILRARLM